MKIGIDISQIAYEGTGVAEYTRMLVESLLKIDHKNEYVIFYSSLRKRITNYELRITNYENVTLKKYRLPTALLDILWNRLHILPIEWFIGEVDVFISSDWVQPPTSKAKKVTVIHDLSFILYPREHHSKIKNVQKRRLKWTAQECDMIICDSKATKRDCIELLGINNKKLIVIYPGCL